MSVAFIAWQKNIDDIQSLKVSISLSFRNGFSFPTYDTNRLSDEAESATKAHVLRSTARRPQSNDVLDTKEDNQTNLHPEERFVGEISIRIYRRQNTKY